MPAINLTDKLAAFEDHWQPRVVGQFNGHDLMVVKVKGAFVWHTHEDTDDFFLVLKGRITIRMREGDVSLGPGELFVVPKGVEHCPVAEEEAHLLLIEPTGTPNQEMRPLPHHGASSSHVPRGRPTLGCTPASAMRCTRSAAAGFTSARE